MNTRAISISLLAVSVTVLTGCDVSDFGPMDRFHEEFHYSYELAPKGRVSVESFNGSIDIEGWDQDKVEVNGTRSAATKETLALMRIEAHNDPNRIELRAIRPSSSRGNLGVTFTLKVPRSAMIDRVVSSNGHVKVTDVAGLERAKTSNSSIDIAGVHGPLVLRSSNGHIHVDQADGAVEAETSNSSIRVFSNGSAAVKVSSSNGAIEIGLKNPPKSEVRAHTSNSSITLRMPEGAGARLKADTSNNSVHSDFELTVSGEMQKKSHLAGTIGTGGPSIDLSSSNGSIRILKGL